MKAHKAVGLAKPLYLPDDITFRQSIVPYSVDQVRSNIKRSASAVTRVTRHETANGKVGANAKMHERYLHGGPRDANGNKVYAGYNCVSDDVEIIQLTPYDEDTWAAGNYEGNHTSDHHELCVNAGINHARAREIAAALDAAVIHARGLTVEKALVMHQFWWGKWCPALILNGGLWAWYVNRVKFYYNQIVAFLAGKDVGETVADQVDGDIAKGDYVIVIDDNLNLRTGSGTSYRVQKVLDVGTGARVKDGPRTADGYTWWDIEGDFGSGWVAANWIREVSPPKPVTPAEAWPYMKPIAPSWWAELREKGHVITDGILWTANEMVWETLTDTGRYALAIDNDDRVGPDLKKGDRFRSAAVGTSLMSGEVVGWGMTEAFTRFKLADVKPVREV